MGDEVAIHERIFFRDLVYKDFVTILNVSLQETPETEQIIKSSGICVSKTSFYKNITLIVIVISLMIFE